GGALVTASLDGQVRFWDLGSGQPRGSQPLPGTGSVELPLTFSPDGRLLATLSEGARGFFHVWEVPGGGAPVRLIATLPQSTPDDDAVFFLPDGRLLAARNAIDQNVALWELPSGRRRAALAHTAPIRLVCISPDGRLLATGTRQGIRLWEVATGQP